MKAPKKRLGRGLDALLRNTPATVAESAVGGTKDEDHVTHELPLTVLQPGRYQPRLTVSEESLAELADSIREQGVLQPLVVRPLAAVTEEGVTHEIVAGERRWRASGLVGLAKVPVVVRELDDQSALAVALIENLQREDLNPIEQAQSLTRLAQEFELTHQQVADAVGRSRSAVSNLLRLLDLNDGVKEMLATNKIEMGHARALLSLKKDQQLAVARKAATAGWSVRQVEKSVRSKLAADENDVAAPGIDMQTRWLQEQLVKELGRKVTVKNRGNGKFKLDIDFKDLDELQLALDKVGTLIGQLRETAGPRVREASN